MKSLVILLLLIIFIPKSSLKAQRFSNDWINNGQTYFKFNILKKGIYRIDYLTFTTAAVQAGANLTDIKPNKIQVFAMGKEIPIYVEGDADGELNFGDFVEFYATPNDGKLDTRMYINGINDQLHDKSSLYSDTGIYFITFLPASSTRNGLRYAKYTNKAFNSPKYTNYIEVSETFDRSEFHYGVPFNLGATDMGFSEFNGGEGYRSSRFGASVSVKNKIAHLSTQNFDATGFEPILSFAFMGDNNIRNVFIDHKMDVSIGRNLASLQPFWDTAWEGFNPVTRTFTLNRNLLDTGLDVNFVANISGKYNLSNVKFSHAKIIFPAKFNLNNNSSKSFVLEPEFFSPRHISWINYRSGYSSPVVYCLNLGLRIEAEVTPAGECRFMTPLSQIQDTLYLADENDIGYITKLTDAKIKKFDNHVNQFNYLIISHRSLAASASEYAAYRSNRFTAVVMYTDDLYNSFSYGYKHPLSIRYYCDYLLENSTTFEPKYLMLIGKGTEVQYLRFPQYRDWDLVPVYGTPGSDNILTSGLKGSSLHEPAIPTGRLTAINNQQVRDYLEKIRDYESAGNKLWRKEVLHLGGGADATQAARILRGLNDLVPLVEQGKYAGRVTTFSKNSTAFINPETRQATIDNINSGKSIISFVGHGSSSVFDLDVGQPTDYENVGRYPICYFNGCSTGNPFGGESSDITSLSYGLQMIRLKKRGAIAFIAQTSLAEETSVLIQLKSFYNQAYNVNYGAAVGDLLKFMISSTQSTSDLRNIHSRQLLLQGDPAIIPFSPDKPEYQITTDNISLEPSIVSALADSFILRIKIKNLGAYDTAARPTLTIRRTFQDGKTTRDYNVQLPAIRYEYILDYVIYSKDPATAGENLFTIEVNPFRIIPEYGNNYINNKVTNKPFNIANNGISLIFPERFGIVSGDTVELVFQPLNLFIQNQPFVVELDTSRFFDPNRSSAFRSRLFNEGSIAKWKVALPDFGQDSVAWYWRAYLILGTGDGGVPEERSFTNINTHPSGWCQTEYVQLEQGLPNVINLDSVSRRMEFVNLIKPIWIDMTFNPSGTGVKEAGLGSQDLNFGVGKTQVQGQIYLNHLNCPSQGLVVMLWDRNSLERFLLPSMAPRCYWGSVWVPHVPADQPAGARYQAYYVFDLGSTSDQALFIDLVSKLDAGTYVTGYSHQGITPAAWTPAVRTAFNNLGCIKSDSLTSNNTVYVFRGQKGSVKGSADENYVVDDPNTPFNEYVFLKSELIGAGSKGTLTSEQIGPVDSWGAVYHWFETDFLNPGSDNAFIDIYARNGEGKDSLIHRNIKQSPIDISGLDAEKYRFVYLKATFQDEVLNTCPQLKEWRVTYKPVPEGTIDPSRNFVFHKDTLEEGDSFKFGLNFTNISKLNFKKDLTIDHRLFRKKDQQFVDGGSAIIPYALLVDSTYRFNYAFSTSGMDGAYQFEMIINEGFKQAEQLLTNNTAVVNFEVVKDRLNPLLDVTFDGRTITNNEIVSPNPLILVVSKDENKMLLQKDSGTFTVMLKYPNATNYIEIPISSPDIVFIPANDANNLAKLEFRPKNLADGIYTLKVQSQDGSENPAGDNFYEISFRVINEQTVTNFYPYPNPFSTSMKFVFTLTGAEVPEDIRISIMTLSGKVVRQITKEELGDIHLGNNISQFTWNGTDQFGDKLANGVYLYKVDVKDGSGKEVKEATFDAADAENRDKYFKKNIGKIYIMR